MNKTNIALGIALVAVVIAIGGFFFPVAKSNLGSGTRFPNGLSADSTSPSAGEVRGTTLTSTGATTIGGDLTVTTSDTATSTATIGCIQTYATSTATPVMLVPVNYATTTLAFNGSTTGMAVVAVFGTCPI